MKKICMMAALLCSPFLKAQQQNSSFSLAQAIEYALKNSPGYQNAALDQKSAEYKRNEIAGAGLPQISGSLDLKDYISIPTSLIPGQFFGGPAGTFIPVKFGTKYNSTAGFSASQLIFSSDYIFGVKAAKEFINLSRINVTRSKADLYSQVSKAYYNLVINKERTRLLDANIVRIKRTLDDTKAMNQQGYVELIDVERLEVAYNNLVSEREKVGKLIGLSESMLKFQMGYKLSDPITVTDTLAVPENSENLIGTTIDVTKRPEYQALQAQQKLYEMDVKRQKWGYLPTLAAYGSYQYNAQRQQFDFTDQSKTWFKIALIGATLNLNIFDGLQRHYRIQQAKITAGKNLNNIRMLELSAELEATVAGTSYANAYTTMMSQKKNMELAAHVYDVTQKKYTGGVGSNIEIVTAETALIEAQTNYYNAVYDMLVAKIDYAKATGTLVK